MTGIASAKVGPSFDTIEQAANRRIDRERRLPGTEWVVTDFTLWPPKEPELAALLEASLQVPR